MSLARSLFWRVIASEFARTTGTHAPECFMLSTAYRSTVSRLGFVMVYIEKWAVSCRGITTKSKSVALPKRCGCG